MDPKLFGLDDPKSAMWASQATPTFDGESLTLDLPLGSDRMSVYTTNDEENIVTEIWIAISGQDRQRSSVRATEISLGGDLAVYSANVGISVSYKCIYSTKVGFSQPHPNPQAVKMGKGTKVLNHWVKIAKPSL